MYLLRAIHVIHVLFLLKVKYSLKCKATRAKRFWMWLFLADLPRFMSYHDHYGIESGLFPGFQRQNVSELALNSSTCKLFASTQKLKFAISTKTPKTMRKTHSALRAQRTRYYRASAHAWKWSLLLPVHRCCSAEIKINTNFAVRVGISANIRW